MTRDDDFIAHLEGYLEEFEGSTPMPGSVRDAVRARIPSTMQRPAWWPARRLPSMNNTAKLAFGAAAVVVVALLSFTYIVAPNVGGPPPTATATPSPRPIEGGILEPGTYALGHDLNATITVPAGWTDLEQRGVLKEEGERFMGVVFWPFPTDLAQVYADPCSWATTVIDPPVGPTVDDLANALAAQAMRGNATPTDVTVDGYHGKLVEMSVPSDIDFADCDLNEFRSWAGRFHHGPGQIDRVYILDVDGERQVLIVHHMPGATPADLEEQQAVFESIDFLP